MAYIRTKFSARKYLLDKSKTEHTSNKVYILQVKKKLQIFSKIPNYYNGTKSSTVWGTVELLEIMIA